MSNKNGCNDKQQILLQNGTLNKNPGKVSDNNFKDVSFFDPNDLVQVKYEMIRAVEKDTVPVFKASETYGFSRISFYKIQKAFKERGMEGLLPQQRGPHSAHKLNDEVMQFVNSLIEKTPGIKSAELIEKIKCHFSISVHKRTIERALEKSKKKRRKI